MGHYVTKDVQGLHLATFPMVCSLLGRLPSKTASSKNNWKEKTNLTKGTKKETPKDHHSPVFPEVLKASHTGNTRHKRACNRNPHSWQLPGRLRGPTSASLVGSLSWGRRPIVLEIDASEKCVSQHGGKRMVRRE